MKVREPLSLAQAVLVAGFILVCALIFWNPRSQSSAWIFPFFSGAANLDFDLAWRIEISGYSDFARLAYDQQVNYWFNRTGPENLMAYSVLDRGYVYIIWLAQNLFFWLPPIKAVIWFQIVFHIVSSLWVMNQLGSRRQKIVFMLAYAVNPIVLHFVTFAYLYYWQVVPSLAWFWHESLREGGSNRSLYLLCLILAAAFLIRQSTALVSFFILACSAWRNRKIAGWLVVSAFVAFVVIAKNPSEPWHTVYVGLGAYQNSAGVELNDASGFKMFKDKSGIQIDTAPPNGNWYDEEIRGKYYEKSKAELLKYAKNHPIQLVRNAMLNVLQSFSVGYPVGHLGLAYVSAFIGLVFLTVLIVWRMYEMVALIFFSVAGFVFYFPPIPAYMFGCYLLLALALVNLVNKIGWLADWGIVKNYLNKLEGRDG